MNKKRNYYFTITLLLILLYPDLLIAQCSMCKAAVETSEGQEAAKSLNNSILYLMVFPYLLMAFIGFLLYKKLK